MKWNWGTGIALAMALFMTFLVILVVKASFSGGELQYEDYYEQELAFQQKIDARERAKVFKDELAIRLSSDSVKIILPLGVPLPVQGEFKFSRPNDSAKDLSRKLDKNVRIQGLKREDLVPGKYGFELSWTMKGETYLITRDLEIPQ